MELLPTEHRHGRNSPIPVDELARHGNNPYEFDSTADFLIDDLAVPGAEPAENVLPATPARIAVAVVAVVLLCGGTTAASMIIAQPLGPAAHPNPPAAGPIHGIAALRPDLLRQARWPFTANGGISTQDGAATPDPALPHSPDRHLNAMAGETVEKAKVANPDSGSRRSARGVVHDFYRRLGTDPARASRLLSPDLLGAHASDLTREWERPASVSTRSVRVTANHIVRAEIVAEYPDGSRLVLQHLFTVQPDNAPTIIGVELLHFRYLPTR